MPEPGAFITGTDTGIGKTWVGCALARALRRHVALRVRKPVESGCVETATGLLPRDAWELNRAAGEPEPLAAVCPYRFRTAVSPARAAVLEKRPLTLELLVSACRTDPGTWLLVEGAGGFYSPIAVDALNADLAAALGLPVLVVAPDRLGVINQVLLTLEAIRHRGLIALAVFLNLIEAVPPELDNAAELKCWTRTPVVRSVDELLELLL